MLAIIAESALEFALLFCGVQMFAYRLSAATQRKLTNSVFALVSLAFAALVYSFAISDFSLELVFKNSHTLKPLIYKLSGTWANHEGSILLFVLMLAGYSLAVRDDAKASAGMGGIIGLFLAFILFSSNPFTQLPITPQEGMGLNPLLQDVGLAFHPPLLYMGYTGFAAVFAVAVAVMLRGEFGKADVRLLRRIATIAWSFLTVGITLGSWWAYRELGWGGFWFWDPVENSSLVPWFLATALIHSLVATEKRQIFQKWSLMLAIVTFLSCVAGFFLVRSGLLSSVHAFAVDPARGYFILAILCILALPAFIIYGARAAKFESDAEYKFFSRESAIQFNNLFTVVISASVFIGTIFPFVLDIATGDKIAVGAPFYNQTVSPILMIVVVIATAVMLVLQRPKMRLMSPMAIAHIGLFVMAIGIFSAAVFSQEKLLQMKVGEHTEIGGKKATLSKIVEGTESNYVFRRGEFEIDGHIIEPETRIYPIERQDTTESGIHTSWFSDYYIVIGEKSEDEKYAVRVYYKPLINLIWIGCLMMFAAGMLRFVRLK